MLDRIQKVKIEKLEKLLSAELNPYPERTERTFTNGEVLERFNDLNGTDQSVSIVGRVRSLRLMGKIIFFHIEDGTGKIQGFYSESVLINDEENRLFSLFKDTIEIGDFISITGTVFLTKQNERSIRVEKWQMLAKNLRPVPTEYFGLKDTEMLLRKRYLDLMMNPETRELFRKKRIFWHTVRHYLAEDGFLEVQTPVLEHIPGGAEAEPFITHHNALDQDFYLRISLELALKRLLVGGLEKVFEIGRVFRNEGIDRDHLQEYDMVEFYAAYWDLAKGMEFSEKMFKKIIHEILGTYTHEYEGNKIDWEKPFPMVDYFNEFKKATRLDLEADLSAEALCAKADELRIKYEKSYGLGKMIDTIYKKAVRPKLIQPCFLTGHPLAVSPLSKIDPSDPKKVLRFQIVAGGSELCNAFSELNDPIDQRKRFEEQMQAREGGDKEAQMMDEDFVEALEYGLPPAFGFGMSERLFSFIMDKSIRETIIFPPMKEKE
jgi:lysyl-tRNA synthetase, class II